MKKVQVLELQKNCGKYESISNNLSVYKGICGVWVMYDNNDQLLEVAQTSDIYKELNYDLSWLMKDYSNEPKIKKDTLQGGYLILIRNLIFYHMIEIGQQLSIEI